MKIIIKPIIVIIFCNTDWSLFIYYKSFTVNFNWAVKFLKSYDLANVTR